MRVIIAVILLLSGYVAGCMDTTDSLPGEDATDINESGRTISPDERAPLTEVPRQAPGFGNLSISWEDCSGAYGWGDVPRAIAEEALPEELAPAGLLPQTVDTFYMALECPRVVVTNRVYEDAAVLVTILHVEPRNESLRTNALDWFVLDFVVDGVDLPLDSASQGEFNSAIESNHYSWSARTQSTEFSSVVPFSGSPDTSDTVIYNYWIPEDEGLVVARATLSYTYDQVVGVPGVFVTQGPGSTQDVFGPVAPTKFQGFYSMEQHWVLDRFPFNGTH